MARRRSKKPARKIRCNFDREDLILRFMQVIPSTATAVDKVVLDKVELALQEALNNAVLHACGGDPKKKVVVCCLCDETKGMLLVVRDHGPGFDPKKIPDPTKAENLYAAHGRGIFLMRELMDEVQFEEGGRVVVMKKTGTRQRSRPSG
jgi:serine/threonine-protein kinase RsbW